MNSQLMTLSGVGLVSFLFLGSSLILFKPCRDTHLRHWPQVRRVVLAFLLHFLCWWRRPVSASA
jgi:O-antigen ligase